jgi:hypothetical protein
MRLPQLNESDFAACDDALIAIEAVLLAHAHTRRSERALTELQRSLEFERQHAQHAKAAAEARTALYRV